MHENLHHNDVWPGNSFRRKVPQMATHDLITMLRCYDIQTKNHIRHSLSPTFVWKSKSEDIGKWPISIAIIWIDKLLRRWIIAPFEKVPSIHAQFAFLTSSKNTRSSRNAFVSFFLFFYYRFMFIYRCWWMAIFMASELK